MTGPDGHPVVEANSVVVATKNQVASDLAGEVVLLSLKTGMYYGLDRVGARIWELIQEPTSVAAVRDAIVSEYDVGPEQCQRDTLELLQHLAVEGLIEVDDAAELA